MFTQVLLHSVICQFVQLLIIRTQSFTAFNLLLVCAMPIECVRENGMTRWTSITCNQCHPHHHSSNNNNTKHRQCAIYNYYIIVYHFEITRRIHIRFYHHYRFVLFCFVFPRIVDHFHIKQTTLIKVTITDSAVIALSLSLLSKRRANAAHQRNNQRRCRGGMSALYLIGRHSYGLHPCLEGKFTFFAGMLQSMVWWSWNQGVWSGEITLVVASQQFSPPGAHQAVMTPLCQFDNFTLQTSCFPTRQTLIANTANLKSSHNW